MNLNLFKIVSVGENNSGTNEEIVEKYLMAMQVTGSSV